MIIFQITNLMHNSFILQQYVCYTTILNMFFEQHAPHPQEDQLYHQASGIVTLHKQPYSMQVESGLQSALHLHTVRLFVESDDTRGLVIQFVLLRMSSVLLETC